MKKNNLVILILLIVLTMGIFTGCTASKTVEPDVTVNDDMRNRLIYVMAEGCSACTEQEPIFNELSLDTELEKDYIFTKIDISDMKNDGVISYLESLETIEGTPMIYILSPNSEVLTTHTGVMSKEEYLSLLKENILKKE